MCLCSVNEERSDAHRDRTVADVQNCRVTGVMAGADATAYVEQQALCHERHEREAGMGTVTRATNSARRAGTSLHALTMSHNYGPKGWVMWGAYSRRRAT